MHGQPRRQAVPRSGRAVTALENQALAVIRQTTCATSAAAGHGRYRRAPAHAAGSRDRTAGEQKSFCDLNMVARGGEVQLVIAITRQTAYSCWIRGARAGRNAAGIPADTGSACTARCVRVLEGFPFFFFRWARTDSTAEQIRDLLISHTAGARYNFLLCRHHHQKPHSHFPGGACRREIEDGGDLSGLRKTQERSSDTSRPGSIGARREQETGLIAARGSSNSIYLALL